MLQGKGYGGQLTVDDQWITISRKGLAAKATHGLSGEKRIPIASVTAVQFKKAGITNGFIQFAMQGSSESKRGLSAATSDENTVMFTSKHNDEFAKIRDHVEAVISTRGQTVAPALGAAGPTVGAQLKELADLRDAGVLTEDEFAAQKAKLLG